MHGTDDEVVPFSNGEACTCIKAGWTMTEPDGCDDCAMP